MMTARKGAHLLVLTSAFLVAFLIVAQAKPSPYVEPRNALPDFHEDITTLSYNEAAPLTASNKAGAERNRRHWRERRRARFV